MLNGIEAGKKINFMYNGLPMIAVTMNQEDVYLKEIIGAGFKGFIYKPDVAKSLTDVIDHVMNNEFVFLKCLKFNIWK